MVPDPENESENTYDPNAEVAFTPSANNPNASVEDDLAALDHLWSKTPAKEGFEQVPDGKYQAWIKTARVTKGKQAPFNLMVKVELTIAGPHHQGKLLFKNMMLMTEDNIGYAKKDFAVLGVDVPPPLRANLPLACMKIIGMGVNVTVKSSGVGSNLNTNVYFDGVFQRAPSQAEEGVTEAPAPF